MNTEFSILLHTFGSCFALNLRLSDSQCDYGGDPHESRILAGYYVFHSNISFTFLSNLYAHPTYPRFGPFCNFFGDF